MFAHSVDCTVVLTWQGPEQTIIHSIPWSADELLCITAWSSGVEMLMSSWLCFSSVFCCKFCVLFIPCSCKKYMLKKYPTTYWRKWLLSIHQMLDEEGKEPPHTYTHREVCTLLWETRSQLFSAQEDYKYQFFSKPWSQTWDVCSHLPGGGVAVLC